MALTDVKRANRRLAGRLALGAVAMFGFAYLLVPLYDILCEITGIGGRTSNEAATVVAGAPVDRERTVMVEFVASLNQGAPWEFHPQVVRMEVNPGEFYQTHYVARNLTGQALVGQAVPSVAPGTAAQHFQKVECFCFERQEFRPGESRDMPLAFRIDPRLPESVRTVTLSYTFFMLPEGGGS